jgi:hypothetical protein
MSDTNPTAAMPPRAHELLATEIATFARELPRLLANDEEGRWVVIHLEELIGIWDTVDDALQSGYERFPLEPFLVRQLRSEQSAAHVPGQRMSCQS